MSLTVYHSLTVYRSLSIAHNPAFCVRPSLYIIFEWESGNFQKSRSRRMPGPNLFLKLLSNHFLFNHFLFTHTHKKKLKLTQHPKNHFLSHLARCSFGNSYNASSHFALSGFNLLTRTAPKRRSGHSPSPRPSIRKPKSTSKSLIMSRTLRTPLRAALCVRE